MVSLPEQAQADHLLRFHLLFFSKFVLYAIVENLDTPQKKEALAEGAAAAQRQSPVIVHNDGSSST